MDMDIDFPHAINDPTTINRTAQSPTPTSATIPCIQPCDEIHETRQLQNLSPGKLFLKLSKNNSPFPASPVSPQKRIQIDHTLLKPCPNVLSPRCKSPTQELKSPQLNNKPQQSSASEKYLQHAQETNVEALSATNPTSISDFSMFRIAFTQPSHCHPVAAERLNAPSNQSSSSDLLKNIPLNSLYPSTSSFALDSISETMYSTVSEPRTPSPTASSPPPLLEKSESMVSEMSSGSFSRSSSQQKLCSLKQSSPPPLKIHKKAKPSRSIAAQSVLHQTPYEREIAGVLRLDVFSLFREDPASLLITMVENEDMYGLGSGCVSARGDNVIGNGDEDDSLCGGGGGVVVGGGSSLLLRSGTSIGQNMGYTGGFGGNGGGSLNSVRRSSNSSSSVYDSNATLVNGSSSSRFRNSKRRNSEQSQAASINSNSGSGGEGGPFYGGGDRLDSSSSGLGNSSPKRRRTSSPTKPLFATWSNIGSSIGTNCGNIAVAKDSSSLLTGGLSRPKPPAAPVLAKYVPPTGEGANDKVRPLPFPLIDQELIDDYTQCKEPGDVVTWKKTPISFPEDMEGYSKLAPDEIETCSILRVPPADYIQVKNILLSARKHFDTFTKRQAQKWYGIDVNKTGKIFDWFVSKNWLVVSSKGKAKK
ncbi:hypothetical protein BDR26DRAFT_1003170 [Obelidium mucronatum]|nr:hypothetical protein BDR26DRAFT_1003170 [Obelidium mucronatum]